MKKIRFYTLPPLCLLLLFASSCARLSADRTAPAPSSAQAETSPERAEETTAEKTPEFSAAPDPAAQGPLLESTGDETDRTQEIAAALESSGGCRLGDGVFYVTNLKVGQDRSLAGSGIGRTELRMLSGAEGSAVSLGSRSSVRDLTLFGGADAGSKENGGRNGVAWQGTYVSLSNTGTYPLRGQISNVLIHGFSGAGILCSNTSMLVSSGMNVMNVNVYDCWAGIEIRILSEYHRFTNIQIDKCTYGLINNGGNNCFYNCGFSGNRTGILMDNAENQSPNSAHGSFVGCTVNHSGKNTGEAVRIMGIRSGEVFSACQFFYGKIVVENSSGVHFNACNFGSDVTLTVDGEGQRAGMTLFSVCVFRSELPVTEKNGGLVIFTDCYLRDGTPFVR